MKLYGSSTRPVIEGWRPPSVSSQVGLHSHGLQVPGQDLQLQFEEAPQRLGASRFPLHPAFPLPQSRIRLNYPSL